MVNTVTTNGMLLDARRLAVLEGVVDLIAISLDGAPESHDRMRNSPRAFETMRRRLPGLRESGIPFGFLFTLTQHNLHELDWVADFALEQGATTLQIHPLEEFGRAREELVGEAPDGRERSVAFLEFVRLQSKVGERLHLQIDLADSVALRRHPERVYADSCGEADLRQVPLAHLLSPLVVEIDGEVTPLQYGFPEAFSLGNLHQASLVSLADRWRDGGHRAFHALCRRTFDKVTGSDGLPFVNWYEALAREGRASSGQRATSLPILAG
jgi:MoaA/NifB/PqqE/SkfB family radical SAM enzyme